MITPDSYLGLLPRSGAVQMTPKSLPNVTKTSIMIRFSAGKVFKIMFFVGGEVHFW